MSFLACVFDVVPNPEGRSSNTLSCLQNGKVQQFSFTIARNEFSQNILTQGIEQRRDALRTCCTSELFLRLPRIDSFDLGICHSSLSVW